MYQITNLNLIPGSVLPVVNVSQYDKGRQFQLLVSEGEYAYDLTGKTVTIRGTKPDMHGFDYGTADGVLTVAGNVVNVFTTTQMTAVAGQVMAELRIASGATILGTINFIINVEESALSDDTIISDTEIPVIERDFEAALAEAEADALKAEGYAVGTQDGTPATSGQPYYHDNAKYYKEQAEAAGSGTGANALKAEGYAVGTQDGVPVTSGSPYYHNNAAYYDGTAQTSATNAGNSESAAAGSASAAAADALEAEGFAVGEQNGVPVSSGSPYYQNNAKYYSSLSNPTALANMSDVDISSPTNNQVLKYNSTSHKWENGTGGGGASALDDLTDVTITTPTSGDGLLYDGSKWVNGGVATPTYVKNNYASINLLSNTVGWIGKNWLKKPYYNTFPRVNNGVTWTEQKKDLLHAEGQLTGNTSEFAFYNRLSFPFHLESGTYILSGGLSENEYISLGRTYNGAWQELARSTGNDAVFTVNSTDNIGMSAYITGSPGTNVNSTFYPMIRSATEPAGYEPPHKSVEDAKCDNSVIGTVEDGETASKAYKAGAHFIRNGSYCSAITAIAQGATLTLGTNYAEGSVEDMFMSRLTYNGDCNDLGPGIVYYGNSGSNAPFNWAIIQTIYANLSGSNAIQIAYCVVNFAIAYRYYAGNTWSAWKQVTFAS